MCDVLAVGAVGDLGRLPGDGDQGWGGGQHFPQQEGDTVLFLPFTSDMSQAPGTCVGVVSLGGSLLGNCEQSWLPRNVSVEGEPSIIANKLPSK